MVSQPPSQKSQWTFQRVMWATLVLLGVATGFWLIYRFSQVVFILFVAIILGTVIRPAVTWLYKHGLPRIGAIFLVYFLMLVFLSSFLLLLLPLIIDQGATIVDTIPNYYTSLRTSILLYPNPFVARLGQYLPATLPALAQSQQTGSEMLASAGQAFVYLMEAARIIFFVVIVFVLAFYWTLDGPRIIQSLLLLVSNQQRDSLRELITAMEVKVGLYIVGQGFLCLVIGIMALAAYLLIGLPNALVLALIAGVLEAVPMVGPLLGAIPAAVIALSISPTKLIWVVIATIVIQQLENSFLVPRVMRKAVGVNPFVSLLSIFAFSSLFGIAGTFMAIPIAALVQIILDRFIFYPAALEAEGSDGRDYSSRLRYTAQELVQDLRKQARLKKGGSDQIVKQVDQVLDEIETLTTDLDLLLAQAGHPDSQ